MSEAVESCIRCFQGRIAGDDEERTVARQRADDLLGHAVAEVRRRVAAFAAERQHGDRRPVFPWHLHRRWWRGAPPTSDKHPVGPDRPADVLEALLAEVLERERQLVPDEVAHRLGHDDLVGRGQLMNPRSDVDAVAEQAVLLDDHVLDADADAHPDRHRGAVLGPSLLEPSLQVDRPANGINSELANSTSTASPATLDQTTAEIGQVRLDDAALDQLPGRAGRQRIGLDQLGPAGNIGEGDRGQAANDFDRGLHRDRLQAKDKDQ